MILGTKLYPENLVSDLGTKGRWESWREQGLECEGCACLRDNPKEVVWGLSQRPGHFPLGCSHRAQHRGGPACRLSLW